MDELQLSGSMTSDTDTSLYVRREFESFNDVQLLLDKRKQLHGDRWKVAPGSNTV